MLSGQSFQFFCKIFVVISFQETVHAYLGHAVQAIVDNKGYGFGQKQESMLEMLHQLFRLYRKSAARTTGETPNKIDVITRMYIQSLQIICAKTDLIKPKSRKKAEKPTVDEKLVALQVKQ